MGGPRARSGRHSRCARGCMMTEPGQPSIAEALLELGGQVGGVDLPIPPRTGTARFVDFSDSAFDPIDEDDTDSV